MSVSAFHVMAKPIGPICNLKCEYCFYLDKENLYPNIIEWRMSDETLEKFIKQFIESQNIPDITFAWQGGEPTLAGIDFFRKAVVFQKKYADGKRIHNTFQTNGIKLDDEWCPFFKENNFLIGLSIDGPEEIHNRMRLDKSGKGSFRKVMKGLDLLKKHDVQFNTLTCVHKHNSSYPKFIYDFLKEIDSKFIQFIPIVERVTQDENPRIAHPSYNSESGVTDWTVEGLQYGKFLSTIFDEWVRKDVGKYFVQIFDVALEAWVGMKPNLCIFNPTCGEAMAIEHNGDLYSCDHYVFPENLLGNIYDKSILAMANSEQQRKFGLNKRKLLPDFCKQCVFLFACNGGCPKNRIISTPDGVPGLNYLCDGYKHFFAHVDPYMRVMANELANNLAPANVMKWAKEKDEGFTSMNIGRNDPCPCGSGKKYKQCCAK